MVNNNMIGAAGGLLSMLNSGKDSTSTKNPMSRAQMAAMMRQRDLDAINGKIQNQSMTKEQHDSLAATFKTKDWLDHIDKVGYQVVPKQKTSTPK